MPTGRNRADDQDQAHQRIVDLQGQVHYPREMADHDAELAREFSEADRDSPWPEY